MANTTSHAQPDRLRERLEKTVRSADDANTSPDLVNALRSLLAAMNYEDPVLMRHHFSEALEYVRVEVEQSIEKRLGWPQRMREILEQGQFDPAGQVDGLSSGNMDDFGTALAELFDKLIGSLFRLRSGHVQLLLDHQYEVANVDRLDNDIRELRELKEEALGHWPWSEEMLPPVDRDMVAESRASYLRGEGEGIEDLIQRMAGHSAI